MGPAARWGRQAHPAPRNAGERGGWAILAGRALGRVSIRRIRRERDLRQGVSDPGPTAARLDWRGDSTALATRRPRAFLSGGGRTLDGCRDRVGFSRGSLASRHAGAALCHTAGVRHCHRAAAAELRRRPRRTAVPHERHDRKIKGIPNHSGAELEGRSRKACVRWEIDRRPASISQVERAPRRRDHRDERPSALRDRGRVAVHVRRRLAGRGHLRAMKDAERTASIARLARSPTRGRRAA